MLETLDPRYRQRVLGRLAPACLALCALCGCATNQATPPQREGDAPVVRRGTFQPRLLLTGELKAIKSDRIVVPRTPTWRMPVRWMEADGAAVKQGQKVLELDNTQFTGDLEQKRLAEATAVNDLNRKQADIRVDLADKQFAVEQHRIAMQKAQLEADIPASIRPRREYQEKQLELEQARVAWQKAMQDLESAQEAADAELDELRIGLRRAREEIQTAELAIAALTLFAPRDGILVVSEHPREGRKIQVGDNVWVGMAVMTIPELSEMKVEARLSDVDDGKLALGAHARCVLDTYPELTFEGTVEDISPIAREDGWESLRRVFSVTIPLDSADPERMRPGMSVKAELLPAPVEQVLIAPRTALDFSSQPARARLADGSTVEIEIGPCSASECVIVDGLTEGARLKERG